MSIKSRVGAIAASVLLLGSAAAAVASATVLPAVPGADAAPIAAVRVPAAEGLVVCQPAPGSAGIAYDEMFNAIDVVPATSLVAASIARGPELGAATVVVEGTAESLAAGAGGAVWSASAPTAALALAAEPAAGEEPLLSGGGVWRADVGDFRGIAALPCLEPAREAWLVGGSTEIGHSAVLTVTNPSATPATLEAEAWGPLGAVTLTHVSGAVVAPGATETYLLEASASGLDRIAVRVSASGADVAVALLDTRLDGITPRGIDVVAPGRSPATDILIPVVSLVEAADEADPASGASTLLLANPGSDLAIAAVTLLGPEGPITIPGAEAVSVDPGAVYEITLAGLPAGNAAIQVTSDVPLLAAAQSVRVAAESGAMERAWSASVEPTLSQTLAAPGAGAVAAGSLVISAPGEAASVRLAPVGADGAALPVVDLSVPSGAVVSVPADPGAVAYGISSNVPVAAGLLLTATVGDGDLIGILPAIRDADQSLSVSVEVRGR